VGGSAGEVDAKQSQNNGNGKKAKADPPPSAKDDN
jgi:hypothetical protein